MAKNARVHLYQSPVSKLQIPCSLPSPRTVANSSPSSRLALLDHHPFSTPRSLLISCSLTEPYPSLHHIFGMTYHLNHHHFFTSTAVIEFHVWLAAKAPRPTVAATWSSCSSCVSLSCPPSFPRVPVINFIPRLIDR